MPLFKNCKNTTPCMTDRANLSKRKQRAFKRNIIQQNIHAISWIIEKGIDEIKKNPPMKGDKKIKTEIIISFSRNVF